MSDKNQLQLIAQESGLEPSETEVLLSKFGGYFAEAKQIAQGAKEIVVTDENDITTMAEAKEKRLNLKRIRVDADKTRKELKEQSLREGRAIDGIANVIKALIVPVEEHLEAQEKFAERLIAQKETDTERYRIDELGKYVDDATVYSLHPKNLSDEAFEKLLENSRYAYEAKKKAEEQAELEQIEKAKKERLYNQRQMELLPFSRFIKIEELGLDTTDKEFERLLSEGKNKSAEYDKEQERIRKENEKLQVEKEKAENERLKAEENLRKEQEKIRKEKLAQQLKEKEARELEEKKKLAEEEERKRLLLAPDKDKLIKFVNDIQNVQRPHLETLEAGELLEQANDLIIKAVDILRIGANKL